MTGTGRFVSGWATAFVESIPEPQRRRSKESWTPPDSPLSAILLASTGKRGSLMRASPVDAGDIRVADGFDESLLHARQRSTHSSRPAVTGVASPAFVPAVAQTRKE